MRLKTGLAFIAIIVAIILISILFLKKHNETPLQIPEPSTAPSPVEPYAVDDPLIFSEPQANLAQWPESELEAFKQAVAFYRDGKIQQGNDIQTKISDPTTRQILDWIAIRTNTTGIDRARIEAFLRRNPDWPSADALRRRIETLYLQEAPTTDAVISYFDHHPPQTTAGKIAYTRALIEHGHHEQALAIARPLWREATLSQSAQRSLLDQLGEKLTKDDHRTRLRRLLYASEWGAATELSLRMGRGEVALVEAFAAISKQSRDAGELLEAVPKTLQETPEWLLAKSRFERRNGRLQGAADALVAAAEQAKPAETANTETEIASEIVIIKAPIPDDEETDTGTTGQHWVMEQRIVARALLDAGNLQEAYKIAALPFAMSESERIDASFFAGWIALRFINQPEKAAEHFAEAAPHATLPISIARVAYWRARAAQALGKEEEAKIFLTEAAGHATTYYGQLAREALGLSTFAIRDLPQTTPKARFDLSQMKIVQAIRLLFAADEANLALLLLPSLAQSLDDNHLVALAELIHHTQDARAALVLGKAASYRGKPFDIVAFPTFGIPDIGPPVVEEALTYAIARQESTFDGQVISPAGARGLMQLMPATAQETARNAGMPFDQARLTTDFSYNASLGSFHLKELIERWNGSYILAIAAYNAGSGNVRKWIAAYGDPRSSNVDPIDWIERIPFTETRNYVQRVLENLQVYRLRLNNEEALMLAQDMHRGKK